MPLLTFAAAVALTASMQATSALDADLYCRGRGDRFVTTTTKVRNPDGSFTNRTDNSRVPFTGPIHVRVAGGAGQAMIPDDMLADDDARGWHELKKLQVTDRSITGKIYFNWLFSPVFSIDRATGTMTVDGSLAKFSGTCDPYDPRTATMRSSRLQAPAPRYAQQGGYTPPSSYSPPPSNYGGSSARYTPPAAQDPRAAARAAAARANVRATANSAALKADLAFRLFNSSRVPITNFVMLSASGSSSKNWLRPGESVAPQAFRNMNFATGSACRHNTQITFANGARLNQSIDYCRKDILYVSDRDMWIE